MRSGDESDAHTEDVFQILVGSLGEYDVFFHADGVIAHGVDGCAGQTAEVFGTRQGDIDETVHELAHAGATESDLVCQWVALAGLEGGYGLLGLAQSRLLPGNAGDAILDELDLFLVFDGAKTCANYDFQELRSLHRIFKSQLFFESLEGFLIQFLYGFVCHVFILNLTS